MHAWRAYGIHVPHMHTIHAGLSGIWYSCSIHASLTGIWHTCTIHAGLTGIWYTCIIHAYHTCRLVGHMAYMYNTYIPYMQACRVYGIHVSYMHTIHAGLSAYSIHVWYYTCRLAHSTYFFVFYGQIYYVDSTDF